MEKLQDYMKDRKSGEIANAVGISAAYFSQILSGKKTPSYKVMCRIQSVTGGAVSLADWQNEAVQ